MDYASSRDNKFYEKFGKVPPEVIPHITEEEREKYRKQALEGHKCEYFQMGSRIICQSGENEHGRIIAHDKMLLRTENNVPIFGDYPITRVL